MELIILGLKRKSDGKLFVFDVEQGKRNIAMEIGETKVIDVLSPYPFSNFSSLDDEKIDFDEFDKCYLKVDGDLKDSEYRSMRSGGIVYYRFNKRQVTLIEEFHDIFQYSLQMLNSFGSQLGTYELTTWVMHDETRNEAEYEAMKKIILKSVQSKDNKKYGLDISLDKYTLKYINYFRELSNQGYNISFGRYGSIERNEKVYVDANLSTEDVLYLLNKNSFLQSIMVKLPNFNAELYNKYIANTELEIELMNYAYDETLSDLLKSDLDCDEIYGRIFKYRLSQVNIEWTDYESLNEMMNDDDFEVTVEHRSPFDYYCCEDCDGYDIYEQYTDEELAGYDVEIDDRVDIINDLLVGWYEYLSEKSYPLFDFVSVKVLEKVGGGKFTQGLLKSRKSH